MIIFYLMLAVILTFCGSRLINFLYSQKNAPLTFKNDIERRAKFRVPILFIILFACIINFSTLQVLEIFYLMSASFFLALIICTDFEQYIIFDKMLLPFAILGVAAIINLQLPAQDRIIAAIFGGGIFFALAVVTGGGLGGGDIKLIAVLGLWLGTEKLLNAVIISCVLGGVVAIILILMKRKSTKDFFPYGAYLALTTIFILCVGKSF